MAAVIVSREARRDLQGIRTYIRDELQNPEASRRILKALRAAIEDLRLFPGRGRPLDMMLPVHTPYRYLPCEHYCIFYVEAREQVLVIRVLHERQDCMRALFAQKE